MPEVNRKQAYFPEGATRIDNHWGTAIGFALDANQCLSVFAWRTQRNEGNVFQHKCALLEERFALAPHRLITFKPQELGNNVAGTYRSFSHEKIVPVIEQNPQRTTSLQCTTAFPLKNYGRSVTSYVATIVHCSLWKA